MTLAPSPVIGLRRRHRASGEPFMVAVLDEDLHVPAGSELHLRRLHDGRLPTPEFALQVVPPTAALSKRERAAAAEDRLDGSAIRIDARDHVEQEADGA